MAIESPELLVEYYVNAGSRNVSLAKNHIRKSYR